MEFYINFFGKYAYVEIYSNVKEIPLMYNKT